MAEDKLPEIVAGTVSKKIHTKLWDQGSHYFSVTYSVPGLEARNEVRSLTVN